MEALICPGCGEKMIKKRDPDILVDTCPRCRGLFLDRGELDVVATGAAGDIEYSPIDVPSHLDRFPVHECPKCGGRKMEKVTLLRVPDVILDRCTRCKGFYLDRGECEEMNEALRQQAPNRAAQEFRGRRAGHLVRVERVDHTQVEPTLGERARVLLSAHLRVTVYFHRPLSTDVRILQNKWTTLLVRLFGLVTGHRIKIGNEAFDRLFTLHAEEEERALDLLSLPFVEGMVSLARGKPSIYGTPGEMSLSRTNISYSEGPYRPEKLTDMVEKSDPIVERLLRLAELIDGQPPP